MLAVLLFGPPGAGKGTQAAAVAAASGVPHIATGDMFREHLRSNSELGQLARSYMERGDLQSIEDAAAGGFQILQRIARNAAEKKVRHQVVFGFSYQNAPRLVDFLRDHRAEVRHLTGVRYSGELGHPFHVVDEEVVVLPLDHPFVPGGRFASLLIRDAELARDLIHGFEELWRKAMRNLQEINFDPRRPQESPPGA